MNLFRSEAHVRAWSNFKPGTEEGIIPLSDLAHVFSGKLFTRRPDPDYVSHMLDYMMDFSKALKDRGAFWQM